MNRLIVWALVVGLSVVGPSVVGSQDGLRLTGSGATFPFPLYSTWFKAFSSKQKVVSVDYQGNAWKLVDQGSCVATQTPVGPGSLTAIKRPS